MSNRQQKLKSLFVSILKLDSSEDREAYLNEHCADDPNLQAEAIELLAHEKRLDGFLDAVPDEPIATLEVDLKNIETQRIGPYKIREQLGEGGMGAVYVAEQTKPIRRRVALKIIKPGMDSKQVIARFEAERQTLAMMSHPNIAKVLDGGTTENGRPYFVMELVKGIPITEFCDQQKLRTRERLELFITVCQAVQHAHLKGIIHRDLKPSNVMVELHDVVAVPKVIDFGIAKATNQQLTQQTVYTHFSQLVGTPLYMSPEQAEFSALDVDTRSDVYSLGVMLYELLTGTTPFGKDEFRSSGLDEIRRIIREVAPPRPSHRISTLDNELVSTISDRRQTIPRDLSLSMKRELDWIVMRALEKDRTRRYESASALADDVRRYLDDVAVRACPPSMAYTLRKFTRRHRGLATAAILFTAFILIASGLLWNERSQTFAALTRETDQRRNAQEQRGVAEQERAAALEARTRALQQERLTKEQRDAAQQNLYYADMRLAQDDWRDANVARLSHSLDKYNPDPGQPDLRGWEWYYLLSLAHQEQKTLYGHRRLVSGLSWSPDGTRLASTSTDGSMKVWDISSGDVTHDVYTRCFAWGVDWDSDGKRVACGTSEDDSAVRILDLASGEVRILRGHRGSLRGVQWSPDGKFLASVAQSLRIWELASGENVWTLNNHSGDLWEMTTASWSPDGQQLVLLDSKGIEIRDTKSWEVVRRASLPCARIMYNNLMWQPNGSRIAIGGSKGKCLIWDSENGKTERILQNGNFGELMCLAWSPNGQTLACGGTDNVVRVWDADTGELLHVLRGHRGPVTAVTWGPENDRLASASSDTTIKIWDLERMADASCLNELSGSSISWNASGEELVCVDADENAIALKKIRGTSRRLIKPAEGERPALVRLSPDGTRLAAITTGDGGEQVCVFDAQTDELLWRSADKMAEVLALEWAPSSDHFATTSGNKNPRVDVWCAESGQPVNSFRADTRRVTYNYSKPNAPVSWSPDSKRLVTGYSGVGGTGVCIWDAFSGKRLSNLEHDSDYGSDLLSVAWSPDGRRLAAGASNGKISTWDASTGEILIGALRAHSMAVTALDWSPDSQRFATGGGDRVVKIWEAETGEELLELTGHEAAVVELQWSPSGRTIATAGVDGVIRLWDTSAGFRFASSDAYRQGRSLIYSENANRPGRKAVDSLTRAIELNPENGKYWTMRGRLQMRLHQWEEAIDDVQQATRLQPKKSLNWLDLALVQAELGQWQKASANLEKATELDPSLAHTWYHRAMIALKLEDTQQYQHICRNMLDEFRDAHAPSESRWVAWTCALAPGAIAELNSVTRFVPILSEGDSTQLNALGAVLYRAGRYEDATQSLREAIELWGGKPPSTSSPAYTWFFLAMAEHKLGHAQEAQVWLAKALQQAEKELALDKIPWNRRVTLELLRDEANRLVTSHRIAE